MKRLIFCFRIILIISIIFNILFLSPGSYSQAVKKSRENIIASQELFKEGQDFYKKHNYINAKIKFQQALIEDPENKKAKKSLRLCNKEIEKEKNKRGKAKARTESKAWGLFGVRKEGLEAVLSDIPVKGIPQKKLTLDECIEIAIQKSLTLEIAEKQVKLAKIRLWEARRKLAPAVKAKWEESSGKIYGMDYIGRKVHVEGSQPIFHGGELFFIVGQANVNLEIVKNDYDKLKNELILKVEKGYYSLDKAIKFIEIQQKIYERTKELYDFAKRGYQAGIINKIEFLNTSSKFNQINFQLISAQEDISLAKLILQQAMNTEEDIDIVLVGEPQIREDISLNDCYDIAYTNRPEMKINYLMSEYYLYEKKIAGARRWPKLDVMGMYGSGGEGYKEDGITMGPEWYAGVKVSLPFFGSTLGYSLTKEHWQPVVAAYHGTDSLTHTTTFSILDNLKIYSDLAESDIGFGRAKQEYNRIKQDITLEVKETFFKYKKALLQMEVSESKIKYQRRQLEYVEAKRERDEALISDVLEQLIKLGEEEFSLLQAFANYDIAVRTLNKAIGIPEYFSKKKEE